MTEEEQKATFARNLNNYIANSGKLQKEVAKDLGISPTTFNTWCVGKIIPGMGKVQKIADYFHIGKSDLLDDQSVPNKYIRHKCISVPVLYCYSPNLSPFQLKKMIISTEEVKEEVAQDAEVIGLKINDDSMAPKFAPGDIAIIKKQESSHPGDIVLVSIHGENAVLRRYEHYQRSLALLPLNPAYEPLYFPLEAQNTPTLRIIGRVIELRSKF